MKHEKTQLRSLIFVLKNVLITERNDKRFPIAVEGINSDF